VPLEAARKFLKLLEVSRRFQKERFGSFETVLEAFRSFWAITIASGSFETALEPYGSF